MPAIFDRYEANNSDFRKHMMSDETRDPAKKVAYGIAIGAIARAGRSSNADLSHEHYGDEVDLEDVTVVLKDGIHANPRAAVQVVANASHSAALEFGVGTRPAKRPLGSAAAAAAAAPGITYGANGGENP